MKKYLFLLLILLSGLGAMAQTTVPAANDTTLFTITNPFTPSFRYVTNQYGRLTYVYNPVTLKYDLVVTSKYLRANYAPISAGGYFQIANNLSEGVPATIRTNIGLGLTDVPTFNTVTVLDAGHSSTLSRYGISFTDYTGSGNSSAITSLLFQQGNTSTGIYTQQQATGFFIHNTTHSGQIGVTGAMAADRVWNFPASQGGTVAMTSDIPAPLSGTGYLKLSGTTPSYVLPQAVSTDIIGSLSATASGTNTYTASLSPAIISYITGQLYYITFTNGNTAAGTMTLNLNGLGNTAIKKAGTQDLEIGDIASGQRLILQYDGSNFQIVGSSGVSLPTQNTNAGKVLYTDGANRHWGSLSDIGALPLANVDSNATSKTVVRRNYLGYIQATYFNTTAINESPSFVANRIYGGAAGDTYIRPLPIAAIATALGLSGYTPLVNIGGTTGHYQKSTGSGTIGDTHMSESGLKTIIANGAYQSATLDISGITKQGILFTGTPDSLGYEHAAVYGVRDSLNGSYSSSIRFYTEDKSAANSTDTKRDVGGIDSFGNFDVLGYATIQGGTVSFPFLPGGTYLGYQAGNASIPSSTYNTYVGYQVGHSTTTGYNNSLVGFQAGAAITTGFANTGNGLQVLQNCISCSFNFAGSIHALNALIDGVGNNVIGAGAMERGLHIMDNAALGRYAGRDNQGDSSVFIGNGAGMTDTLGRKQLYIADNPITTLIRGQFAPNPYVTIGGVLNISTVTAGLSTDSVLVHDGYRVKAVKLGTNAYNSTAYLPLTGGALTGQTKIYTNSASIPSLIVAGAGALGAVAQGQVQFGDVNQNYKIQGGSDYLGMNFIVGGVQALSIDYSTQAATFSNTITATGMFNNAAGAVVGGSTSGTATFKMTDQGTGAKKVMIYCAALNGTAIYSFPTAFTFVPSVITGAAISTTITTTGITVTGTTQTGFIILEGY